MTELETMQRAKMYIDKMAKGINPLTDQPAAEEDMINNVRISRCLFYVAQVLDGAINAEAEKERKNKPQKQPFTVNSEKLKDYIFCDMPVPVSLIANNINHLIADENSKNLRPQHITDWLVSIGMLGRQEDVTGKVSKYATKEGISMGVVAEERQGQYGKYYALMYDEKMQRFIVDNLPSIAEFAAQNTPQKKAEKQGLPWTAQEDSYLTQLFNQKLSTEEIAATLQRSTGSVYSRLKKLHLV